MPATPMGSEEKLSTAIGNTFNIETIERNIIPILCKTKIDEQLASDTDDLFARERDNVWRDEIYQFENYLKMLGQVWKRDKGKKLLDSKLFHYVLGGIEMIERFLGKYDKNPVGWARDNDVCETIMKISLIVDLLNRYGKVKIVIDNKSHSQDTNRQQQKVRLNFNRGNIQYPNCEADSNIERDSDGTDAVCCDESEKTVIVPTPTPEFETDPYTSRLLPVNSKHPFAEIFEKDLRPKNISGSSSVLGKTGLVENCTCVTLTILTLADTGDRADEFERENGIVASLHVLHDRLKSSFPERDLE